MPSIRVINLGKKFGDTEAVKQVSFAVSDGELLTLLGPSGCGKTTTLNIIAGFEELDEGDIYLGDHLISSAKKGIVVPPYERELGMVFQTYALWPHLTVYQNIAYGLRMRNFAKEEIKRRVEEVFRVVRLEGLSDRFPGQLSGGQQQRVALARAIAYRPKALLLDEPLSNLDATLREEMRIELKELHERTRLTTVYVTHDQAEAMVLSDRIAVMDRGQIVQLGTPSEIYTKPANKFVATFIGLTNVLHAKVLASGNGVPTLGKVELQSGQEVQCVVPSDCRNRDGVLLLARAEDLDLHRTQPSKGMLGKGKVEKVINLGNILEYWVRLDVVGTKPLRVHTRPSLNFALAEELYVSCEPSRCSVVREE